MSHKESDNNSCGDYFRYSKSFPENVEDAICNASGVYGATGPTGPMGPSGTAGSGVNYEANVTEILAGVNGWDNDREKDTYVSPSGWYHASNQYVPLVETRTITNETFTPDALNASIFDITYNGNCAIASPANCKNGRTITICLRQGGNGNNTLSWDPIYHFDGGYHFVTETEGAKDVMVGTKINDFVFSTLASDCKSDSSTILGSSSSTVY